ncbi:hypothetical protein ACFY8P_04530 [Streptomyces sp. NPDC012693]|uniref:hypothetical protein n=1 Tax=Streptomyces sp. NPDC012693 TaxID=3364844 RepID=UPI003686140E
MTTPQQHQQAPNADDFLMGGGGAPTAKFPTPGTTISGRITQKPTVEQQRDIKTGDAKFWGDGNPMWQVVVTVQTELRDPSIDGDDGRRRLFVKGAMKNVISEAVNNAGARGLEVGGTLAVTYTHDGVAKQVGMSPPKQYTATYTPAAVAALHTPDPGQAAQQQYAPPVAAPPAGLTQQQYAAAQQNPATQALLAQQQAQAASAATPPPF